MALHGQMGAHDLRLTKEKELLVNDQTTEYRQFEAFEWTDCGKRNIQTY